MQAGFATLDRARDLAPLKLPTHPLRTLYLNTVFFATDLFAVARALQAVHCGDQAVRGGHNEKLEGREVGGDENGQKEESVTVECVANRARKAEFRCCWTTGAAEFLAEFAEGLWS